MSWERYKCTNCHQEYTTEYSNKIHGKCVCKDCYDKLKPIQEKRVLDRIEEAQMKYLEVLSEVLSDCIKNQVSLPITFVNRYNQLLEELNQ
jgi:peptide subunit release factor 1 (eRF1)